MWQELLASNWKSAKRPVISPLNAKSALQVGDEREKNETSGESVE